MSQDTLQAMRGMQPSMLPDMKDGKVSQIVRFFLMQHLNIKVIGTSISLITNQMGIDADGTINQIH